MDIPLCLNNAGAVVTLGLGLMGLARPSWAAAFTSIRPEGALGTSEIRATYGGFFAALGGYGLVAQSEAVFMVVGVAWIGAAVGRVISVGVDRSVSGKNFGAVMFELGIGVLLVVG